MPERPTGETTGDEAGILMSWFFPGLNHINYRHIYGNNAIPPYGRATLALDLELTVAEKDFLRVYCPDE